MAVTARVLFGIWPDGQGTDTCRTRMPGGSDTLQIEEQRFVIGVLRTNERGRRAGGRPLRWKETVARCAVRRSPTAIMRRNLCGWRAGVEKRHTLRRVETDWGEDQCGGEIMGRARIEAYTIHKCTRFILLRRRHLLGVLKDFLLLCADFLQAFVLSLWKARGPHAPEKPIKSSCGGANLRVRCGGCVLFNSRFAADEVSRQTIPPAVIS